MIAIILAAGRGSRLNSYTEDLPKSLLPLNTDTTILDYNLDLLNRIGIEDKLIVTGYEAKKIETHIEHLDGIKCIYNPFWDYCNVLGSLYMALPYVNEEFVFLHADTIVEESSWEKLIDINADMVLPYQRKECGKEEMKVKHNTSGNLLAINKTMDPGEADGEFLGIAKFSDSMIKVFKQTAEHLFKKRELNHYMEAVVEDSIGKDFSIQTFDIGNSRFVEIDFEEDYNEAKILFG